jgi:hypothetical protein
MKTILELKADLINVNTRIKKLTPNESYLNSVSKSFHLGRVGGSGRNIYRLNKRREQALNRSLQVVGILSKLYQQRSGLEKQIEDIESGNVAKREETVITKRMRMAELWKALKVGDEIPLNNPNGNPKIKVKNRLSVISDGLNVKYTASEIIGREAAKYI